MSTITLPGRAGAPLRDVRYRAGWTLIRVADALYSAAHRVSDGGTPTRDALTLGHLERVGDASGIPASELVRLADERGMLGVLR